MQIPKTKTITIAVILVLSFSALFAAVPFASAQVWSIYIAVTPTTGLVTIEVRNSTTARAQVPFTGISLGYLTPGGAWQNITGLTTTDGRVTYYFGTLTTNGVWHFQARVPAQSPLPANPATPDGSWYSQDLTTTISWQSVSLPTFCIVNSAPNPIGKDQPAFLNVFMSKPIIGATMSIGGTTGTHYIGLYIDITRPDGVKETFGPYVSDPTGGFWMGYTPTMTGNYTLQGRYLGQDYRDDTGSVPLGKYKILSGTGTTSTSYLFTYLPDESPIRTWTVQDQPVGGWSQPPLPTEYWSRPITATNWDWGRLEGSNWWGLNAPSFASAGGYDATGNVQPYGTAPNSAHIMWTKSLTTGGQPGGTIPSDMEGQFTSTSILKQAWQPISAYGIIFYQQYLSTGALGSGIDKPETWYAVDIRTGEVLWTKTRGITGSETLVGANIQKFHSVQEYGSWGALWSTGTVSGVSMCFLYDLWTGQHLANVTSASWGSAMVNTYANDYRENGGLLRWYVTGGMLTMWNSTKLFSSSCSGQQNWTNGYQWQINMSATYPAGTPTGVAVCGLDYILLSSYPAITSYASQNYFTAACVDAATGKFLWGPINYTIPQYHDISMYGRREGVWTLYDKDTQECYCYSLKDGTKLWGPVSLAAYTTPFDYIEMDTEVYNGVVVFWGFGGTVVGLNATTGDIMWHWTQGSAEFVTPHGVYPLWDFGSESFADGKCFFSEGSMYDVPLHPAYRVAINVTDGTLVWKLLSFSGRAPGAISDGYLIEFNSISNEMISIGKGPSATTVSIANDVTTFGHKVMVTGMVTDVSPGTNAYNREARFPNGVPAISDADQEAWMEYVYMQQAKPADAKGVDVVISVYDPNGNTYDVGTATSDSNGKFQLAFDPEVPGEYHVYARFAGSESYYGSQADTGLFVEQAPVASPTPPPITLPPTETYVAVGTGLIILAVVIVGILLLRKH